MGQQDHRLQGLEDKVVHRVFMPVEFQLQVLCIKSQQNINTSQLPTAGYRLNQTKITVADQVFLKQKQLRWILKDHSHGTRQIITDLQLIPLGFQQHSTLNG